MFISLLGVPGVGKTTLGRAIARRLDACFLAEPEEADWPSFVQNPHSDGAFTLLSWFRSQRVPSYYEADRVRRRGGVAVLDSYYDKWCLGWLGRPGLEWLMAPSDPYLPVALGMAAIDARVLPRADLVILLEIAEPLWRAQLHRRHRLIDIDPAFLASHHSQSYFRQAAIERAAVDGTQVLFYQREDVAPESEARLVLAAAAARGLLDLSNPQILKGLDDTT